MKDQLFKGALFCVEGYSRLYGFCQTRTFLMPVLFVTFVRRFFADFKDFGLLAHLVLYMSGNICLFLLPKASKYAEFFAYKNFLFLLNHFALRLITYTPLALY